MNRRRLALALLLALTGAMMVAAPALAHALLVRSSPDADAELLSPPGAVEMWFSEPLEPAFSNARLVGPDGQDVQTGAAIVDSNDPTHMTLALGSLEPGIYTVAWQTLSQVDGHEWFGSFPFTLLNPDGSRPAPGQAVDVSGGRGELPTPGEAGSRWLMLVPAMLIAGGAFFQLVVVPGREAEHLARRAEGNLAGVIWLAAAGLVVGVAVTLLLQAGRLGGAATLTKLALGTRTGLLGMIRVLLAAILGMAAAQLQPDNPAARALRLMLPPVAALLVVVLTAAESPITAGTWLMGAMLALAPLVGVYGGDRRRWSYRSLAIGSLILLLSFSTASHAGAAQGSLWAVLADLIHLAAASVWFSGLVLLAMLWIQTRRASPSQGYLQTVKRFSAVAGVSVFVILVTGTFGSLVELPSLRSLWTTAYGRVLLVKLGLVFAAMAIAYTNNRRVRTSKGTERLPSRITLEAGVATGILLVVAFLVQTPTPRSQTIGQESNALRIPFNQLTPTDDLIVHIQVDPNEAGQNRFWVHLYHADGSDIGEVQLVRLFFEHQELQLGRSSVDLEPLGQDTFAEQGSYLSQPGRWQEQVYVRRRGMDDLLSAVQFEVSPAASATGTSPLSNPVPGLPPLALLGGLSLVVGVVPFLWPGLRTKRLTRALPAAGALLVAFGIFGAVRGATGFTTNELPLIQRTNPNPPTSDSLARGKEIYQQSCVICHGVSGKGDGPVGVTLSPRPSDFVIHMPPGIHTDGQLLEWISNGFPDTAMPAFSEGYSEEQLWDVINYIRTFAPDNDN